MLALLQQFTRALLDRGRGRGRGRVSVRAGERARARVRIRVRVRVRGSGCLLRLRAAHPADRLLVAGRLEAVRAALARRVRVVGGVVAPERGGELRLEGALLRHLVGVGVG